MTRLAADGRGLVGVDSGLSAASALRIAWVTWLLLLVAPFCIFLAMIWRVAIMPSAVSHLTGNSWFLGACLYLLVAVPGSFFWRGHVFKAYWTGHTVSPRKYLIGMMSIWLALEIGGIFSLAGCFVENSVLPNLLPALVAFMFFVTLWPSGRAMTTTMGGHEDPAVYEEPR